jgi:hypothetical protein
MTLKTECCSFYGHAECHYAECLYAGYQLVECNYEEYHFAECRYFYCLYDECRYAENH